MYIFLICIHIRMMPESDLISFVAQDNSLEDDEAAIDPAAGTRYQLALQVLLGEKRFGHVDDRSRHEVVQIFKKLHPGRLTWNTIMEVWKIIFLSKWVIFRFHVNLPGRTELHDRDIINVRIVSCSTSSSWMGISDILFIMPCPQTRLGSHANDVNEVFQVFAPAFR